MRRNLLIIMSLLTVTASMAQPKFDKPHGLYDEAINVTITPKDATAEVYYTTDGSTPTTESTRYSTPLTVDKTTLLRAIEVKDGKSSAITTASYIMVASVLNQPNNPEGYPAEWGKYTDKYGTAVADYEMDPEMTNDPVLRSKIIEGLKQIPILSVVTDKGNLFSHENDENTGGIYIFTGPPVGDPTGNGWTRQCSAELFGGPQNHNFTIDCGLKLHGGHGDWQRRTRNTRSVCSLKRLMVRHRWIIHYTAAMNPKSLINWCCAAISVTLGSTGQKTIVRKLSTRVMYGLVACSASLVTPA